MSRDLVEVSIELVETGPGICILHSHCCYVKRMSARVNGVPTDHEDRCAQCFDLAGWPPTSLMTGAEETKRGPEAPSRATKRRSRRQEDSVAEDLGGRRQKASGAMKGAKGDVRLKGKARVECKLTTKDSYRVTLQELSKIRGEAAFPEVPVMMLEFVEKASGKGFERWAVVPWGWAAEHLK